MLQAFAPAVLAIGGGVTVHAVFSLAIFLGVVNAFDLPTRQSFLVDLVGKDDLMNAIALNSSMIQASRVLGPALAGWLGEGPCFLINGISYLGMAPLGSLLAGAVTSRVGAPGTVAAGGALCVGASLLFWARLPALSREAVPMLITQGAIAGEPAEAGTVQQG